MVNSTLQDWVKVLPEATHISKLNFSIQRETCRREFFFTENAENEHPESLVCFLHVEVVFIQMDECKHCTVLSTELSKMHFFVYSLNGCLIHKIKYSGLVLHSMY